ncbi:alkaline phosphatase [Rubellicoccus peritrichatus]|uniref:Alkaline phosphatase n=1 Tax=Rubellicoccus peritrichatus TaxID=3080537 RepID=A0AAQ3QXL9_9BACT|nr:alkaline phosphatase [Puniceicoccus sp. CR14]WOO42990.1 alkaline phosphatase [Puniceicoccus sp. CR14]
MLKSLPIAFAFILFSIAVVKAERSYKPSGESVVFIHPDGAGLASWNIYRIAEFGPDGYSEWDLLPGMAVYRGHMKDHISASSHGGATIHAYGVKVQRDSFGQDGKVKIKAASGFDGTLMQEAKAAGLKIGIINSGHMAEPGTAAMLASVDARKMTQEIVAQLVRSGADLILGGGEKLFLPKGVVGAHGEEGIREDGNNLVKEAEASGYTVIYTLEELKTLSIDSKKVLGIFAAKDTYNAKPEEDLKARGLPLYIEDAPTVADMTEAALKWFSGQPTPFFLMVEEEGTDNFANSMNASGMIEATRRADAAIGIARKYVAAIPELSLIVAADSEASGPDIIDFGVYSEDNEAAKTPVPATNSRGAAMDGATGTKTLPFISGPDRFGQRHVFAVTWVDGGDHFGGVLVRADGPIAKDLPANVDNTAIYKLIHDTILDD